MNQRAEAALILTQVTRNGRSLTALLADHSRQQSSSDSLLKEICFGTLRHYHQLAAVANKVLHSPLKSKDHDVFMLILLGIYQLYYLNVPDYATVSETVEAAKQLNKNWSTGVINKVLRRAIEEKEVFLTQAETAQDSLFSHPDWLIEQIRQDWPNDWQEILTANNSRPPLFLRVNRLQTSLQDFLNLLAKQGIEAHPVPTHPFALILPNPIPVDQIPGFKEGLCSVQDISGQVIANAMDLAADMSVLDACAAPGGKTSHMLELYPDLAKLVAIDKEPNRLLQVKENISRLKLPHHHIQLKLADATHTNHWWDGACFDRILLDAPCSGTGVIRRHPDIKFTRLPTDIPALKRQQQKLISRLWPLLKVGGKLIYSTCSVLLDENESVLKEFIEHHSDAVSCTPPQSLGKPLALGWQFLPVDDGPDGFYFAVLEKQA